MSDSLANPASATVLPLLYHELRPAESAYTYALSCKRFAEQLALFATLESTQRLTGPNGAERSGTGNFGGYRPLLTFDDGHLSNYEYAFPLLQEHGLAAHFFITVGWTGKRADSMNWEQLRALHRAGQHIGAHGWTHTLLTHCSAAELNRELQGAREELEDGVGAPITSMSLPGGRANQAVLAACEAAGYTTIWTSEPRTESLPLGRNVGRFNILAGMSDAWLASLLDPRSGVLAAVQRKHRWKAVGKRLLGDRLYAGVWGFVNRKEVDGEQADGEEARFDQDGKR